MSTRYGQIVVHEMLRAYTEFAVYVRTYNASCRQHHLLVVVIVFIFLFVIYKTYHLGDGSHFFASSSSGSRNTSTGP